MMLDDRLTALESKVTELEGQVSAMSVQTLSETPAPSGYATSKYSVEEMDSLLDYVMSLMES